MDIKSELNRLKEYSCIEYFKPSAGRYKVVILGEGKKDKFIDDEGNTIEQYVFPIQHNKKSYFWSVSVGKTLTSLYGQLLTLADQKGDFNGLVVDMIVQGEGKNKRYTLPDAVEIIEGE